MKQITAYYHVFFKTDFPIGRGPVTGRSGKSFAIRLLKDMHLISSKEIAVFPIQSYPLSLISNHLNKKQNPDKHKSAASQ